MDISGGVTKCRSGRPQRIKMYSSVKPRGNLSPFLHHRRESLLNDKIKYRQPLRKTAFLKKRSGVFSFTGSFLNTIRETSVFF